MSQIRPTLGKALPEQLPPASWNSHALEARAKKSIRHRRLGGGVLAVALLGLAVVVSVTLFPPTSDIPAGDRKPSFPLPELSEKQEYAWHSGADSATTGSTEKITSVLWDHLREHHPELKTSSGFPDAEPDLVRGQRELWTAVARDGMYDAGPDTPGSEKVYEQPVYTLTPKGVVPFDTGRSESSESFSVAVYPKGGYEPGTADISGEPELPPRPQYLVDGCEGFKKRDGTDQLRYYDYTCSHPKAASGQEALAVDRTVDDYDDEVEYTRTVVLYRDDGTAVRISMSLSAPKPVEPSLSATDLLRIAEAIPDVPVT